MVLAKEKIKENDALIYILTKNYGILKCLGKSIFRISSKNLNLMETGNLNRFLILTNFSQFKIISALPIKTTGKIFKKNPYLFLWSLRLLSKLKFPETPRFIWFVSTHLENYLAQNPQSFPYWFLYHLLKERGYEIDLENCSDCNRKLKNFAFFNNRRGLYCFYCKKNNYQLIEKKDLERARQIKNVIKIPQNIPVFLKKIIKNSFTYDH